MPRYRFGLTAGLLALMCGLPCVRSAGAATATITPRYAHTATLLPDRTILLIGGIDNTGAPTTSVQIEAGILGYTKQSLATAFNNSGVARASHTATLLPNGEVLVAGGVTDNAGDVTNTVAVYNPLLDCWHWDLLQMSAKRYNHTATLLRTGPYAGEVLICGGFQDNSGTPLPNCDIFKPAAQASTCGNGDAPGSFETAHPQFQQGRALHTATMLPDGRVFFAGGYNIAGTPNAYLTTTEIYDPTQNIFLSAAPLSQGRAYHTATLMGNGQVFIAGGTDGYDILDNAEVAAEPYPSTNAGFLRSTEIYDPISNEMSYAGTMLQREMMHAVTLQEDGELTFFGGLGNFNSSYRPISDAIQSGSVSLSNCAVGNGTSAGSETCEVDSPDFTTSQSFQLTDFAGNVHNFTGAIVDGWSSYTVNPSLPPSQMKVPQVAFSGGEILFTPDTEAQINSGTGLVASMAGSSVKCLPAGGSCGLVQRNLEVKGGVASGTAVFPVPLAATGGQAVINGPGTNLTFALNPPPAAGKCLTPGDKEPLNPGTLSLALTITGLPLAFVNEKITALSIDLTGGQIVTQDANGDAMFTLTIGTATYFTPAANLTVQLDPTTNSGAINFTGTFTVPGDPTNIVTFSSAACNPVAPTLPGLSMTGASVLFTEYSPSAINLGTVQGSAQNLVFTGDYAVSVVKSMVFGDVEQFMPGGSKPMSWNITSHGFGYQRYSHTQTLNTGGDPEMVGGQSCNPTQLDINPAVCPLDAVPNQNQTAPPTISTAGIITIVQNPFTALSGAMSSKRAYHTTTMLPNGEMLVAGGSNGPSFVATSEVFEPVNNISITSNWGTASSPGSFTPTPGPMSVPRANHTATLLPNGRVLVAGGDSSNAISTGATASAEIFYPDTGYWLSRSTMNFARTKHTANLLPDGNVLVVGGSANGYYESSVEIYYSTAMAWQLLGAAHSNGVCSSPGTGCMNTPRELHTTTLLQDGRILVVGGENASGVLGTYEIYSPATGLWTSGNINYGAGPQPIRLHTATLLPNGKVLVAGGNNGYWETSTCLLFDPASNSWSLANPLYLARQSHTATLLPNGNVAVIGGVQAVANGGLPNPSVEVFDPNTGLWSEWTGGASVNGVSYSLPAVRTYHTATLGNDGGIYVIGGYDGVNYLNSAVSNFYMGTAFDVNGIGGTPSLRQSSVTSVDHSPFKRGETLTVNGKNFLDMTEASGGGAGSANSDQRHPVWILQSMDGSGGGSSQGNSGYFIDLTSRIFQNSGTLQGGVCTGGNCWANINSSITVPLPDSLGSSPMVGSGGYLLPYGWYSLRVGANDQLSPGFPVQAGPHLPSFTTQMTQPTAYTPPGSVSANSITFTWTAPSGGRFDGYNIYVATTGVWIATVSNNANTFTLPGPLVPSTTQAIWVAPYNISGDLPGLPASATAYTLPMPPLNLAIATAPGNTFFVQWSTAFANGQPINGPSTLYECSSSFGDPTFSGTNVTTFPLTTGNFAPAQPLTLAPNQIYYFRVRACNLHGTPYGECSTYAWDSHNLNQYVSTQTLASIYSVYGVAYATDTVVWYWPAAGGGAQYNIVNATIPAPNQMNTVPITTNSWVQTGLSQNTRSVVQVQVVAGGSLGPLSAPATAYSLAAAPVFTAITTQHSNNTYAANVYATTGSIVTQWNILPGGPGPEGNPVTYQVEYATVNWNRSTGLWSNGITPKSVSVSFSALPAQPASVLLDGINQAVPVYIRARALNSVGQNLDPTVASAIPYTDHYGYTDEWVDLVSSTDITGFTSTLELPPTAFYLVPPTGPTSATLWWHSIPADPSRMGTPQNDFEILQTTCVINGFPDFVGSSGPLCGIVPIGLGYPNLPFSSSTALVSDLSTWATYYFEAKTENLPHWENNLPNQQDVSPFLAPSQLYYAYLPGAVPGTLTIPVSAQYGGSISSQPVGLPTPGPQHTVWFSAPPGAFPSDSVVTISTFDIHNADPRFTHCSGAVGQTGTFCGGDPNLVFEITADPPMQPTVPLYFTVAYNGGEPRIPGLTDAKQAVLMRYDPVGCKCVPMRDPTTPNSREITAQLNHLSVFQVGAVAASATPEDMRIYPNPYYASRDGWVTFDGLPAGCRVRIFTLRGEMVLDSNADSHGILTWQDANRGGRAVASGVYLVVAEGNGIKTVRKLAVIR